MRRALPQTLRSQLDFGGEYGKGRKREGEENRGSTTEGVGIRRTPTFAVCTPKGVQRNLRCTPAGYYRLQLAAEVMQFTFGFSIWKFRFLYSLLQQ